MSKLLEYIKVIINKLKKIMDVNEKKERFNILVENCLVDIKKYILDNGGFIDTSNEDNSKTTILFNNDIQFSEQGDYSFKRSYVYGVKLKDNNLYLALVEVTDEGIFKNKPHWNKEDFEKEENWFKVEKMNLSFLFLLADTLEEYKTK